MVFSGHVDGWWIDDVVEEDGVEYESDEDEEVEADNDEGDSRSYTVQGDWHAQ